MGESERPVACATCGGDVFISGVIDTVSHVVCPACRCAGPVSDFRYTAVVRWNKMQHALKSHDVGKQ